MVQSICVSQDLCASQLLFRGTTRDPARLFVIGLEHPMSAYTWQLFKLLEGVPVRTTQGLARRMPNILVWLAVGLDIPEDYGCTLDGLHRQHLCLVRETALFVASLYISHTHTNADKSFVRTEQGQGKRPCKAMSQSNHAK